MESRGSVWTNPIHFSPPVPLPLTWCWGVEGKCLKPDGVHLSAGEAIERGWGWGRGTQFLFFRVILKFSSSMFWFTPSFLPSVFRAEWLIIWPQTSTGSLVTFRSQHWPPRPVQIGGHFNPHFQYPASIKDNQLDGVRYLLFNRPHGKHFPCILSNVYRHRWRRFRLGGGGRHLRKSSGKVNDLYRVKNIQAEYSIWHAIIWIKRRIYICLYKKLVRGVALRKGPGWLGIKALRDIFQFLSLCSFWTMWIC